MTGSRNGNREDKNHSTRHELLAEFRPHQDQAVSNSSRKEASERPISVVS
jgi:hypothetical protein